MKRIILFATAGIAALALAAPVTASASQITNEGAPIEEHTEVGLRGQVRWEFLGTGIRCIVHATLTTEDGTSATTSISSFQITTETCEGFGFQFSGCNVESDTVDGLPWSIAIDESSLTISTGTITETLGHCFSERYDWTGATLTATVDNPASISSVSMSGSFTLDTDSESIPAVTRGTLQVVGEAAGTYAIRK